MPVYSFPPYFSTINFDYGFEGNILVNKGTGYNKGIELTLERYFSDGYYFIVNGTLYESKFKNYQEEENHTKYNGSYEGEYWPTREWKTCRPEQVGMDSEDIKKMNEEISLLLKFHIDVHGVLVIR